jgi:PAS domain S-box-containing protein
MYQIHLVGRDAQSRAALSYAITEHGYRCVGHDTAATLIASPPDHSCIAVDLDSAAAELPPLQRAFAAFGSPAPVIVFGTTERLRDGLRALRLGALDYIVRPFDSLELVGAIERAFDLASPWVDQAAARTRALMKLRLLSNRELQILRGVLAGMSNKEMALSLGISPRTIEMHRANMMADLRLRSLADAIRLAVDAGLRPLEYRAFGETAVVTEAPAPLPAQPSVARTNSDELLRIADLVDTTTDGLFILDHHDRFLYLNEEAIKMIAGERDLLGQCIWDAFPGARSTRAFAQMKGAVDEKEARRFDFFEPDSERWFNVSVRPIEAGLLVCFRDLTGQREALANARLGEERLRSALDAAGDWSWDFDVAAGTAQIGERFFTNIGRVQPDAGSFVDQLQALIHPDDLAHLRYRLDRHLCGKSEIFLCEYRMATPAGGWRWYLDRGRVVSWDPRTGEPARMLGTGSDVTLLKELQRTSRDARERLALAQEHAGAGIWELDLVTRALQLCPRSRRMFGIVESIRDLTHRDWEAVVHPDDVESAILGVEAAARNGSKLSHRFRVVRPDGTERLILGLGKIVAESERRLFLGLNIDLTAMSAAVSHPQ